MLWIYACSTFSSLVLLSNGFPCPSCTPPPLLFFSSCNETLCWSEGIALRTRMDPVEIPSGTYDGLLRAGWTGAREGSSVCARSAAVKDIDAGVLTSSPDREMLDDAAERLLLCVKAMQSAGGEGIFCGLRTHTVFTATIRDLGILAVPCCSWKSSQSQKLALPPGARVIIYLTFCSIVTGKTRLLQATLDSGTSSAGVPVASCVDNHECRGACGYQDTQDSQCYRWWLEGEGGRPTLFPEF